MLYFADLAPLPMECYICSPFGSTYRKEAIMKNKWRISTSGIGRCLVQRSHFAYTSRQYYSSIFYLSFLIIFYLFLSSCIFHLFSGPFQGLYGSDNPWQHFDYILTTPKTVFDGMKRNETEWASPCRLFKNARKHPKINKKSPQSTIF